MDLKKLKEPLTIKDIDFRVQSVNKGGYATILAYKDARVDMNILDDVVGPANWQRDHKEVKGVVYCGIGIYYTDNWIWKWDAGTESMAEKQKGEASDSFKRAGFNWGIGRELYDYPVIQIKLNPDEFCPTKKKATWNFKLKEWVWESEFKDGKLIKLTAKDQNGKPRFNWGGNTPQEPIPTPIRLTPEQIKVIPTTDNLDSLNTVLDTYTLQPTEKAMVLKRIKELTP